MPNLFSSRMDLEKKKRKKEEIIRFQRRFSSPVQVQPEPEREREASSA
jgi:hypothetical protein